jgi:hypothetical protein
VIADTTSVAVEAYWRRLRERHVDLFAEWDVRDREYARSQAAATVAVESVPSDDEAVLAEDVADLARAARDEQVFPIRFDLSDGYRIERRPHTPRPTTYRKHPSKQARRCEHPGCNTLEAVHGNGRHCGEHRKPWAKQWRYRQRLRERRAGT